jgi:sugar/nucleoside kinase (ribokinase family)
LREKLYQQDKCGVSWLVLQEKAIAFAKSKGCPTDVNDPDAFKASSGWISNVLKEGDYVSITLHGKSLELTIAKAAELINPFQAHLAELMEAHDIVPS